MNSALYHPLASLIANEYSSINIPILVLSRMVQIAKSRYLIRETTSCHARMRSASLEIVCCAEISSTKISFSHRQDFILGVLCSSRWWQDITTCITVMHSRLRQIITATMALWSSKIRHLWRNFAIKDSTRRCLLTLLIHVDTCRCAYKPPSVSQPHLHQDSNGTSTWWLIETGYLAAPGWISWGSRSRLEPQRCSGHGPLACGHALELTNPTPSDGSNSEDGGEQPMWHLIGSPRTWDMAEWEISTIYGVYKLINGTVLQNSKEK
jgi:hypothetical protein